MRIFSRFLSSVRSFVCSRRIIVVVCEARRDLMCLLIAAIVLIFLSSLVVYSAEKVDGNRNFEKFEQVLWWSATSLTTNNYRSNQQPSSPIGGLVWHIVTVLGVALFALTVLAISSRIAVDLQSGIRRYVRELLSVAVVLILVSSLIVFVFEGPEGSDLLPKFGDSVWFSILTLAGFDQYPKSEGGRWIRDIIAMQGTVLVNLLISIIGSLIINRTAAVGASPATSSDCPSGRQRRAR